MFPAPYPGFQSLKPQRLAAVVIRALQQGIRKGYTDTSVQAIVLTGANGKFTAGFDITEFKSARDNALAALCDLVESGVKPVVVAIDGMCLGGGLEISVACSGRVCTPESRLGLPELQIGIIPGSGGTQRLPRLVGLKKGIEMMLTAKPITGAQAKELGLVEEVANRDLVVPSAKALALEISLGRRPWLVTLHRTDRIENLREGLEIIESAREQMHQKAPDLRHPQLCLDAILAGLEHGGLAGMRMVQIAHCPSHKSFCAMESFRLKNRK